LMVSGVAMVDQYTVHKEVKKDWLVLLR
jgi:hypothetical protein